LGSYGNAGTFYWGSPGDFVGDVGTRRHSVNFVPFDMLNFHSVTGSAEIRVQPVTATSESALLIRFPAAEPVIYGEPLANSVLIGGSAGYGSFAWEDAGIFPTVVNAGYLVAFTPRDAVNFDYSGVSGWNREAGKVLRTVAIEVLLSSPPAPGSPALVKTTAGTVELSPPAEAALFPLEYAYSSTEVPPESGWQESLLFTGLSPETPYYFFARHPYNGETNNASPPSAGLPVTTHALEALTAADFDVAELNKAYNGKPHSVSVAFAGENIHAGTAGEITVRYSAEPIDAGEYAVSVTTSGGTEYAPVTEPLHVGTLTVAPAALAMELTPTDVERTDFSPVEPEREWRVTIQGLCEEDAIAMEDIRYAVNSEMFAVDTQNTAAQNPLALTLAENAFAVKVTYNGGAYPNPNAALVLTAEIPGGNYANPSAQINASVYDGVEDYTGQDAGIYDRRIPINRQNISAFNTFAGKTSGLRLHYRLTENIVLDADSGGWAVIGGNDARFTGSFDGQGFSISNLSVKAAAANYQGMFGYIGAEGTVRNLGLENVEILTGEMINHKGGIAGRSDGVILNCHVTGNISGNSYIGGIAGQNAGIIAQCRSESAVKSKIMNGGGIVGINDKGSFIRDCYSSGSVTGEGGKIGGAFGGIAGHNSGEINKCYSSADISGGEPNVGGITGFNQGKILSSVALNQRVVTSAATYLTVGRIAGISLDNVNDGTNAEAANNYARNDMDVLLKDGIGGYRKPVTAYQDMTDGADLEMPKLLEKLTQLGWDFESIWIWDENAGLPLLSGKPILTQGF
jgi:hypothetical protein